MMRIRCKAVLWIIGRITRSRAHLVSRNSTIVNPKKWLKILPNLLHHSQQIFLFKYNTIEKIYSCLKYQWIYYYILFQTPSNQDDAVNADNCHLQQHKVHHLIGRVSNGTHIASHSSLLGTNISTNFLKYTNSLVLPFILV